MEIVYRGFNKEDIEKTLEFFKELHNEGSLVSFSRVSKKEEIQEWIKDFNIYIYIAELDNKILGVFKGKRGKPGREHSCFLTAAISKEDRSRIN